MNRFVPICLEWNCYNGLFFHFFHLELYRPLNIDGSLFGFNVSSSFLYIDIFWINFKIFDKTGVD